MGSGSENRERLAYKVMPWVSAALLMTPQVILAASGDPLHPLGNTTLQAIIGRIVSVILGILGSVSLLMFVYGGIVWMTAAGNDEKIKKAKNTIVYAIFGLIIAFASFGILNVFFEQVLKPTVKRAT